MGELDYFSDLLRTFGKPGISVAPQEALKQIRTKYVYLANYSSIIVNILKNSNQLPYSLFKEIFKSLIIFSHKFLFDDYLINAGYFRKKEDENNGAVFFGPFDPKTGKIKFQGLSPELIDSEINRILDLLTPFDTNPIESAIKFYQAFVYIHPFYDGNGRIGRFLISIYLQYYGFFVNWKELEKEENKKRLITKLNRCHSLVNRPYYEKRLQELVDFFAKFIMSI